MCVCVSFASDVVVVVKLTIPGTRTNEDKPTENKSKTAQMFTISIAFILKCSKVSSSILGENQNCQKIRPTATY